MSVPTRDSVGSGNFGVGGVAWKKALLFSGAASLLLYFAMDATAAMLYDGYSYTDQTISELSAIGAPTRGFWVPLGFVYAVLNIAFGYGVWTSTTRRSLRVVAALIVVAGAISILGWPFAPMHQREVLAARGGTFSDTMHLVLAGVDSLLFFLLMAFGATAGGKPFRLYTIASIIAVLAFGAYTGTQAPKVESNEPTPWLGVTERIAVFGPIMWMALLGLTLWRRDRSHGPKMFV